jgi:hypothetical protein
MEYGRYPLQRLNGNGWKLRHLAVNDDDHGLAALVKLSTLDKGYEAGRARVCVLRELLGP